MVRHMTQTFHSESDVHVGRDMGGRDCAITDEMITAYRRGTDDEATYQGAPPLLFHSEVYRNLSWYLPNIIGNLHGGQEWELFRPLPIDAPVRTRSTVIERYRKRGRDYLVNEVLITDTSGAWLQRSRTHQSFLVEDAGTGEMVVDKQREKRADRAFVVGECDGPELDPLEKTITLEMCQAFSGPEKTYHTDQEMARAFGFPDVVVQGMMSVCFVSELLARSFGPGWEFGGKLNVKLVNVVWPNDRLAIRGKVRDETPEGEKRRVHVDVWCEKEDGVKTIVGSASALR